MIADRPLLLLLALVAEAILGYPRRLPHPVQGIGKLISMLDRSWNHGDHKKSTGFLVAALLISLGGCGGLIIEYMLQGWTGTIAVIMLATTGLAQRSLYYHVNAVRQPLLAGDMENARKTLACIVGRDTAVLDDKAVSAAATETLAESFCDGIVAPAFWFLCLGLPGLFIFKAISTADSMIGHLDTQYREFGWASARADDIMNWLPARISAVFICLAGAGGWRILWRDANKHLSPNAGWPESAMAGALGVQLGGGASYDGEWITRATLGDGEKSTPTTLNSAVRIYLIACVALWITVGAIAWLR